MKVKKNEPAIKLKKKFTFNKVITKASKVIGGGEGPISEMIIPRPYGLNRYG